MSEAIKPTPGEWRTNGDEVCSDAVGCIAICGMAATFRGWSGSDFSTEKFQRSNARLIAEAGNVFNETQCTPRQLVEQRDALVERVKELEEALTSAQQAINSMKVEAETAAQGDEQMMLEACETISNEGLQADMEIRAALSKSLPNTAAEVK